MIDLDRRNCAGHNSNLPIHEGDQALSLAGEEGSQEIHLLDVGTKLTVKINNDSQEANSTVVLRFKKPDYTTVEVNAIREFDTAYYITEANFLDVLGDWKLQAVVTDSIGLWHSSIVTFTVHSNIGGL